MVNAAGASHTFELGKGRFNLKLLNVDLGHRIAVLILAFVKRISALGHLLEVFNSECSLRFDSDCWRLDDLVNTDYAISDLEGLSWD